MTEQETDHVPQESPDHGEIVRVMYTADLDRDNLEEYAEEHHPDADYVQVDDRVKTDTLLFHGDEPGYACPKCGREVYGVRRSGGTRVYSHGIDDKCEWQDPEWEPPEHHPDHPDNETSWWYDKLGTAIGLAIPLLIVAGVFHFMPETTLTLSDEPVVFPPDSLAPVVIVLALTVFMIYLALKYAPGMAGRRTRL